MHIRVRFQRSQYSNHILIEMTLYIHIHTRRHIHDHTVAQNTHTVETVGGAETKNSMYWMTYTTNLRTT